MGYLGSPDHPTPRFVPYHVGILPSSKLIPQLRSGLAASQESGNAHKTIEARRALIAALAESHQYEEASREASILAMAPTRDWDRDHGRLNPDSVQWCILNRKAEAESVFRSRPEVLQAANQLIEIPEDRYWNKRHFDDGLSDDQRFEKLVQLGPGVLSIVHTSLQPNTISVRDQSLYARLIGALGGTEDTPALIDTMGLISTQFANGLHHPYPNQDQADLASIRELEAALEKLTQLKPTAGDSMGQVHFWINWWDSNAGKIIVAKPAPVTR